MNNTFYLPLFFIISILFCAACKDDEMNNNTTANYENGIFVTNEGPFQNGTGTISFYDKTEDKTTSKIYQKANNGEELGNIVQSISFVNEKAIIVVNNANKVVIADAKTFEKQAEILDFNQPRYSLPLSDETVYISEWGTGENAGKVQVLNLRTTPPSISKTISVGNQPEKMVLHNDLLYVANSGGFDKDSTISVINTMTNEVVETIILPAFTPTHLVKTNDNNIWVICRGFSDYVNPANSTAGALVKLDGTTWAVLEHIELENGADNLVLSKSEDALYFTASGIVYMVNLTLNTLETHVLINKDFYSLAIDPETGDLLGADAKDYTSNGEIFVYDEAGILLDNFPTGIIPGEFAFVNK